MGLIILLLKNKIKNKKIQVAQKRAQISSIKISQNHNINIKISQPK